MILFFTSAIKGRPLYRRDFLNVCCAPEGTRTRFGYAKRWLADNLRNDPARVERAEALIIYCEGNPRDGRPFTYHPIRKAEIIKAVPEHGSVTFDLKLKSFFNYGAYEGTSFREMLDRFQVYVISSEDQPTPKTLSTNPDDARFAREEINSWENNERYGNNWPALIYHLRGLNGLKESYFFSVQRLEDFGGAPVFPFSEPAHKEGKTIYKLKNGRSYNISLFIIPGKDASQKYPTLEVTQQTASVSGPFVRQRSIGWQADFSLYLKRSFEEERCFLSMRVPMNDPYEAESPEVQALLRVRASVWLTTITILSLIIGFFLGSLNSDAIKDISYNAGINLWGLLTNHPTLSVWLLKLTGLILFSIGAFLAVRKMPVKF